jgi:PilZ domain
MSKSDGRERRKHPRVPLQKGEISVRIHTIAAAPVIDISDHGALLEVGTVLRPGTPYVLRLSFGGDRQLNVKCRVVRTFVHSSQPQGGGESMLTYRAAVEFIDMSDEDRELVRVHIDSIQNIDMEFE